MPIHSFLKGLDPVAIASYMITTSSVGLKEDLKLGHWTSTVPICKSSIHQIPAVVQTALNLVSGLKGMTACIVNGEAVITVSQDARRELDVSLLLSQLGNKQHNEENAQNGCVLNNLAPSGFEAIIAQAKANTIIKESMRSKVMGSRQCLDNKSYMAR